MDSIKRRTCTRQEWRLYWRMKRVEAERDEAVEAEYRRRGY